MSYNCIMLTYGSQYLITTQTIQSLFTYWQFFPYNLTVFFVSSMQLWYSTMHSSIIFLAYNNVPIWL